MRGASRRGGSGKSPWRARKRNRLVPASLRGTNPAAFAQLARKRRYPGIWRVVRAASGGCAGRVTVAVRASRRGGSGKSPWREAAVHPSSHTVYRLPLRKCSYIITNHHKASCFVGALVHRLLVVRHDSHAQQLSWCFTYPVCIPRECCTKQAASCGFSLHARKSSIRYGHHILTYHIPCAHSCLEAQPPKAGAATGPDVPSNVYRPLSSMDIC